jgi:PAS domain-containing protein
MRVNQHLCEMSGYEGGNERPQAHRHALEARDALGHMRASSEAQLREQELKLEDANEAAHAGEKLLQSELALDCAHRLRAVANNVPAHIGYRSRDLRGEFADEAYREMFQLKR